MKRNNAITKNERTKKGFTLIELIISIAIATVITAAIYFSLSTALESWGYSWDQLALQKVLSEVIDEVVNGTAAVYGIRDGLEVMAAGSKRIEFVPPWIDDSHSVAAKDFIYTLNRKIKPGASVPIGEIRLPEAKEYKVLPVSKVELEDARISQVKLGIIAPLGSRLRFVFQPDAQANPDVIKSIWYDEENQQVYSEDIYGIENISRNPFGVKITEMRFKYYDSANNLITESDWVDNRQLNTITGVELYMQAEMGQTKQALICFASIRNAPLRSGYLPLREGTRIPIPDSKHIHSLLLANISGVGSGDELQLEAVPRSGKPWLVNIKFSRPGISAQPKIESFTIEYPSQHAVYTDYPRSDIKVGLDLLTLDAKGLYDYDYEDDEEIEDVVILEGEVILKVNKMDVEGAGLFIRP